MTHVHVHVYTFRVDPAVLEFSISTVCVLHLDRDGLITGFLDNRDQRRNVKPDAELKVC